MVNAKDYICCCGLRIWTRVIGWLGLVSFIRFFPLLVNPGFTKGCRKFQNTNSFVIDTDWVHICGSGCDRASGRGGRGRSAERQSYVKLSYFLPVSLFIESSLHLLQSLLYQKEMQEGAVRTNYLLINSSFVPNFPAGLIIVALGVIVAIALVVQILLLVGNEKVNLTLKIYKLRYTLAMLFIVKSATIYTLFKGKARISHHVVDFRLDLCRTPCSWRTRTHIHRSGFWENSHVSVSTDHYRICNPCCTPAT